MLTIPRKWNNLLLFPFKQIDQSGSGSQRSTPSPIKDEPCAPLPQYFSNEGPLAPNSRLQYNPACIQTRRETIDVEAIIHQSILPLNKQTNIHQSVIQRSQMPPIHNNMPLQRPPPEVLAMARPVIPQNNTAELSIPPTINLPKVSLNLFYGFLFNKQTSLR